MQRFLVTTIVAGAMAFGALSLTSARLVAQGPEGSTEGQASDQKDAVPDPSWKAEGAVPRTVDGHPDLSGVWWNGGEVAVVNLTNASTDSGRTAATSYGPRPNGFGSKYKPEYMAKAMKMADKDDPAIWCVPSPGNGSIKQILQEPNMVAVLSETPHGFRLIPTVSGRQHNPEQPPAYRGDSVGRWEGDTLVVDVTNFNDRNWIGNHSDVSFHSTQLHATERYRRIAANAMEYQVMYDDPVMLTAPWSPPKQTWRLAPFDQIVEVLCLGDQQSESVQKMMDAGSQTNYGRK